MSLWTIFCYSAASAQEKQKASSAYDQKRFGIKMADYVPMTVTDRAYTSPVWYTPAK